MTFELTEEQLAVQEAARDFAQNVFSPYYNGDDVSLPELNLPLRDYQKEGVNWLVNADVGILADDMGLGKTVQTIKAIEHLYKENKIKNCLIVAPLSLQKNWEDESDPIPKGQKRLSPKSNHTLSFKIPI